MGDGWQWRFAICAIHSGASFVKKSFVKKHRISGLAESSGILSFCLYWLDFRFFLFYVDRSELSIVNPRLSIVNCHDDAMAQHDDGAPSLLGEAPEACASSLISVKRV